jgi:Ran GTPase-activating protein (RanGAP) involved in mRNA processing and transport
MSLLDILEDAIRHHILPFVTRMQDVCALRATSKLLFRLVPLPSINLKKARDDTRLQLKSILKISSSIREGRLTVSAASLLGSELEHNTTLKSINFRSERESDTFPLLSIVNKCDNLEILVCTFTRFFTADHMLCFSSLSTKRHLVSINLEASFEERITRQNLETLLGQNTILKRLTLARNPVDRDAITALSEFISTTSSLEFLNISALGLMESDTELVAAALANNSSLKTLTYVGNYPGAGGMKAFAAALSQHTKLQKFDLRTDCDYTSAPYLAQMIQNSRSLRSFSFGCEYLGSDTLIGIAQAMDHNTSLRKLRVHISNTNSSQGSHKLATSIVRNRRLTELSFRSWSSFKHSVQGLLPAFTSNEVLKKLTLSQAQFYGDDVSDLVAALKGCRNLTDVSVSSSPVSTDISAKLAEFCNSAPSITSLSLSNCSIRDAEFDSVAVLLKTNTTLRKLDFSRNQLSPAASRQVEVLLLTMTNLQCLNLSNNTLDAAAIKLIAKAMNSNTTLLHLDLRMNLERIDDGKILIKEFAANRTADILI